MTVATRSSSANGNGHHVAQATGQPVNEPIPTAFAPTSLRLVMTGAALGILLGISLLLGSPMLYPSTIYNAFTSSSSSSNRLTSFLKTSPTGEQHSNFFIPEFWLYLSTWSSFHLLEFIVTAHWNPTRLMKDSFLLSNGWNYHAAHLGGMIEFLLETYLFQPTFKKTGPSPIHYIGLLLVILGQFLRSWAMISAAANFSHHVADKKREDHQLVTTGVYAWVRHPSYTGFFLWAMATQILLKNPIGVLVFAVVLYRFFSHRIQGESDDDAQQETTIPDT